MDRDTIAAIATAPGNSGISIIRISGEEAFSVADRIFVSKSGIKLSEADSHTIHYGMIVENNRVLDEVMAAIMRAPKSYTTEDTVEIDCHGGAFVTKKVLEAAIHAGARPAEPGEFTKRAFLNGRIDLAKAEAVMDVINAKNEYALRSSVSQLKGAVSEKIKQVRQQILYEVAFIESVLDDPEHLTFDHYSEALEKKLEALYGDITKILSDFENGRMLKEGIRTVILGKPNAGKSSLLNLLAGEEKAIVTDVAGTTRDALEETVYLGGLTLLLTDTAGIRPSDDVVEQIGIARAKNRAEEADLILFVVDASAPLDENDREILELLKDKKAIVILNKNDLKTVLSEDEVRALCKKPVISFSAKEGTGTEDLEKHVKKLFLKGELSFNDQTVITNTRQKSAVEEAQKSLLLVMDSIRNGMPEDFYTIDLMNAYESLGKVIGESVEEDLVNEIFAKFCTGK